MTTEYSISVDWYDEMKESPDRWENIGRRTLEDSCNHYDQDSNETNVRYSGYCEKCDIHEDSGQPMMNYAYPLHHCPSEEAILKIMRETCLTVMYNNDTDDYFLVLTGGGMDLSQDIAMAYIIAENRIPYALALQVSIGSMTQSKKNMRKIIRYLKSSIKESIHEGRAKITSLNETYKKIK